MAWEPVVMALFLFGLGGWALYAGVWGSHVHPKYLHRIGERKSFSYRLAQVSPTLERIVSKGAVIFGGLALIAAGVFVLIHDW